MKPLIVVDTEEGCLLSLKIIPRSSLNKIVEIGVEKLKVKVMAPPVEGSANQAVLEFLADCLNKPKGSLDLVSGHRSSHKRVKISGMKAAEVLDKLNQRVKGK